MHAPEIQNTSFSLLYCPLSDSNVSKILPLQNGYPNMSIKPPAAPA